MDYKTALHYAALVLDLCRVSKKHIRTLFEYPDNEVESIRLKATDKRTKLQHELIVAQADGFTIVVQQGKDELDGEGEGGAEGEAAPEAAK